MSSGMTERNEYLNLEDMGEAQNPILVGTSDIGTSDIDKWVGFEADGFRELFKIFSGNTNWKPWWKRDNVCIETEEEDTMDESSDSSDNDQKSVFFTSTSFNLQTCYQTNTKYECVQKIKSPKESKTITVRYQCCYGHQLKNNQECEKIELIPLIQKIKQLDGNEFLIMSQNIKNILLEQNLTVFMPTDDAFKSFADKMLETNQLEILVDPVRRRRSANFVMGESLIKAHISNGFNEVSPDEVYTSLYDNSSLTIKHVSSNDESQFLVNCAKILSSNNYATNGMVHTIDRVLMPATRSIMQIIKDRKNFSTLKLILEKTGLAESLDGNYIWTLFAPTNSAFDKLQKKQPHLMQKLFKGDSCTANILKHHMLSHTFCSATVQLGATGVRNSMGDLLKVSETINTTEENTLDSNAYEQYPFYVERAAVSETDIIASNGVIHAIEDLLVPDSAIPITTLMEKKKLGMFHELIRKADLLEEIDNLSNVTFFIPTDKAIKNYLKNDENSKDMETIFSEDNIKDEAKKELRSFIYHHIVPGALQSCDLENNKMKQPLDKKSPLRINLYSTVPLYSTYNRATIDCARLMHFDVQQCDNILHQVERPLLNNNESIMERVKNNPKLSMLHKVLEGSEIESILEKRNNITFVAPTNTAFEKLSVLDYEYLLENKKTVNMLMKQHIFNGVTCCAGLHSAPWPFTKTIQSINGETLTVGRNNIGGTNIASCDNMGTNGVIHFVDKLYIPAKIGGSMTADDSNVDIVLYGVDI